MDTLPYAAYIFDMDGTLWDAVDSYAAVWNRTIETLGVEAPLVNRERLAPLMGLPLSEIFSRLIGDIPDMDGFMEELKRNEALMMPRLGGRLYPGVRETLQELHDRGARLFMVSNCGAEGVPNFLQFTGLSDLIEDWRSIGLNGLQKDANIRQIIEIHNTGKALYVGDTPGDCASAHAASADFAWAAYGFGAEPGVQQITLSSFADLLQTLN